MRWTLSPTSAHGESTGNHTCDSSGHAFILYFLFVMSHITLKDQHLSVVMCRKRLSRGSEACILRSQQAAEMPAVWNSFEIG